MSRRERRVRVARFGSRLSYSDIAVRTMFGEEADVAVEESFVACLVAVAEGRADIATIPVRNTVVGEIRDPDGVALAERAREMNLRVHSTLELPVNHVLASFGDEGEITLVCSKHEAIGQCKRYLKQNGMTGVSSIPGRAGTFDTASAAAYVAERRSRHIGAICSREAAEHYGVPIVREGIADLPGNSTLFHAYERDE